jgi:hypothetical protein
LNHGTDACPAKHNRRKPRRDSVHLACLNVQPLLTANVTQKPKRRWVIVSGIIILLLLALFVHYRSATYVAPFEEILALLPPLEVEAPVNDTPALLRSMENAYLPPEARTLENLCPSGSTPDEIRKLIGEHPGEMEALRQQKEEVMRPIHLLVQERDIFGPLVADPLPPLAIVDPLKTLTSESVPIASATNMSRYAALQMILCEDGLSRGDRTELTRLIDMSAMLLRCRKHVLETLSFLEEIGANKKILDYLREKAREGSLRREESAQIVRILEEAPELTEAYERVMLCNERLAVRYVALLFLFPNSRTALYGGYTYSFRTYVANPSVMIRDLADISEKLRQISEKGDRNEFYGAREKWEKKMNRLWPPNNCLGRRIVIPFASNILYLPEMARDESDGAFLSFFRAAANGETLPEGPTK